MNDMLVRKELWPEPMNLISLPARFSISEMNLEQDSSIIDDSILHILEKGYKDKDSDP